MREREIKSHWRPGEGRFIIHVCGFVIHVCGLFIVKVKATVELRFLGCDLGPFEYERLSESYLFLINIYDKVTTCYVTGFGNTSGYRW